MTSQLESAQRADFEILSPLDEGASSTNSCRNGGSDASELDARVLAESAHGASGDGKSKKASSEGADLSVLLVEFLALCRIFRRAADGNGTIDRLQHHQ